MRAIRRLDKERGLSVRASARIKSIPSGVPSGVEESPGRILEKALGIGSFPAARCLEGNGGLVALFLQAHVESQVAPLSGNAMHGSLCAAGCLPLRELEVKNRGALANQRRRVGSPHQLFSGMTPPPKRHRPPLVLPPTVPTPLKPH